MNRFFNALNLFGVLAVGVICVLQWRHAQKRDIQIDDLSRLHQQQTAENATQTQKLKDDAADLADLRQRLTLAEDQLKALQTKLTTALADGEALKTERDQLKTSVAEWAKASAERDHAIDQLKTQQSQLTASRDDAIAKFNNLAEKYNRLIAAADKK